MGLGRSGDLGGRGGGRANGRDDFPLAGLLSEPGLEEVLADVRFEFGVETGGALVGDVDQLVALTGGDRAEDGGWGGGEDGGGEFGVEVAATDDAAIVAAHPGGGVGEVAMDDGEEVLFLGLEAVEQFHGEGGFGDRYLVDHGLGVVELMIGEVGRDFGGAEVVGDFLAQQLGVGQIFEVVDRQMVLFEPVEGVAGAAELVSDPEGIGGGLEFGGGNDDARLFGGGEDDLVLDRLADEGGHLESIFCLLENIVQGQGDGLRHGKTTLKIQITESLPFD